MAAAFSAPVGGQVVAETAPSPTAAATTSQLDLLSRLDLSALDSKARAAASASLARWRALGPLPRGRWLLVNIPAYRIDLYDGPARLGSWRAILGKPRTPTPLFTGEARGVILNPWWEVPASIVTESVGRLVTRNPKRAAAQGYVREGSRYRQAPGPANQLGRMKLDFRNAHSVGIHDTPSKPLFDREKRAFSHGCIRVDDPMAFAATLLGPPTSRDSLQAFVDTSRETKTIPFGQPIPVIVTYLTAEVGDDGTLTVHDDVYRRDRTQIGALSGARSGRSTAGTTTTECLVE